SRFEIIFEYGHHKQRDRFNHITGNYCPENHNGYDRQWFCHPQFKVVLQHMRESIEKTPYERCNEGYDNQLPVWLFVRQFPYYCGKNKIRDKNRVGGEQVRYDKNYAEA